jgi:transcriptional regulator with XRE-family HTH domain
MADPGDLGRRVTQRREALGMSQEVLAERAGMDPRYLASVESRSSAVVAYSTLSRLAAALDTTVDALSGAGRRRPPGASGLPAPSALHVLAEEECWDLIARGGIGRVVLDTERGPVALPVTFGVLDGRILFHTSAAGDIARAFPSEGASFEVDRIDEALGEGWSVLLTGAATVVTDRALLARAAALEVEPWAGGDRPVVVCLVPHAVTGRELRRAVGPATGP